MKSKYPMYNTRPSNCVCFVFCIGTKTNADVPVNEWLTWLRQASDIHGGATLENGES